jgi:hypothetical protein
MNLVRQQYRAHQRSTDLHPIDPVSATKELITKELIIGQTFLDCEFFNEASTACSRGIPPTRFTDRGCVTSGNTADRVGEAIAART